MKGKRERERHTQPNIDLQRKAKKDKKVFLNQQCKATEEDNKMRKTRDFFKKFGESCEYFIVLQGCVEEMTEWEGFNRSKRD